MHLLKVETRGFRCLAEQCFYPSPGVSLIHGENAQGKTSLLEAIHYASTTKSHRSNLDGELLQLGAEAFRVGIEARSLEREIRIEAHWWHGEKRFRVNGVAQTRLSEILGRVPVVMFSPEDLGLIKSGAAVRRRFLDMEISQVNAPYLGALQQYRQTLRQRNELLRRPRPEAEHLDAWDAQLAQHGGAIMEARSAYIEELQALAAAAYAVIVDNEALELVYRPDVRADADFASVLAKCRDNDLRRGQSGRGPHRDEMEILVAGQPARSHASQGQQKSAVLALKLAEVGLMRARGGGYPVVLLDEVLAELDDRRAQRLLGGIPPEVQCIVTTTESARISTRFTSEATAFQIKRGVLEKA